MHRYTIGPGEEKGSFIEIEFETFLDVLERSTPEEVMNYCRIFIVPDLFPRPETKEETEAILTYLSSVLQLYEHLQTEEVGISHSSTMICMDRYCSEKGNRRYRVSLGQLDPEKDAPDVDEPGYETEWELNGYAIDPEITENPDISDGAICAEVLTQVLERV